MTETSNRLPAGKPIRALGAIEKMFWMMDQNHPLHFLLIGEVSGETDSGQWQAALDALCRQLPLVWSRICLGDDGEPYFDSACPGRIPLNIIDVGPVDWTEAAAAQLATPFDASRAPLMRATLLHSAERTLIILCAHHSIADGLSLSYFLRDLLQTIAGDAVVPEYDHRSVEQMVEDARPLFATSLRDMPPAPLPSTLKPLTPYRSSNGDRPILTPIRLSRSATLALLDRAKSENCSVHGALCAAVALAYRELAPASDNTPVRIVSPVDVRRRVLPHRKHFGLCISGIVVGDEPERRGFWDKARHFSRGLGSLRTAGGMAALVLSGRDAFSEAATVRDAAGLAEQLFAAEIDLSNLGNVEIPESYGDLKLEAMWGPSVTVGFLPEQSIGAATFAGRLHLLHMSYTPIVGLLPLAVVRLRQALEAPSPRAMKPGQTLARPIRIIERVSETS